MIEFTTKQKNNLSGYTISLLKNCQSYYNSDAIIKLSVINIVAVAAIAFLVQLNLTICMGVLSEGNLKNKLEIYSDKIVNISILIFAPLVTVRATSSLKLPLSQKRIAALSLLIIIAAISLRTLTS